MQGHIFELAAAKSSSSSNFAPLILMVLVVGAFYFFLMRPQRNRQKQQQQMQREIKPGSRVMTTGGMYATVVEVTDDGVVLEIAPGVEAEFVNQAIMKVVEEEPVDEADDEVDDESEDEDEEEATATVEPKTDDLSAKAEDVQDTVEEDAGGAKKDEKASERPSA